ncbi:MAG: polysaccharide deacetylase family protein [bacterium]
MNVKNKWIWIIFILLALIIWGGYFSLGDSITEKDQNEGSYSIEGEEKLPDITSIIEEKSDEINDKYKDKLPKEWGENVSGVNYSIDTDEKIIVLTLDACGSNNDGYDSKLIDYLKSENIPATLFINYRWIEDNREVFMELADNPLFTIGNHGYRHLPLSVNGKSAYDIKGTENIEEVVEEVLYNEMKIKELTGEKPQYFRTGTAFYDEIAIQIVNDLGEKVIGYDTLGDAGATFTKEEVKEALLSIKPGSIILAHMNHPESETAEGIMAAVPELKKKGYKFVKLEDYDHKLLSR